MPGPASLTSQSSRIRSPSTCAARMTLATAPPVMRPRPSSSRTSSTVMSSTSWQMDSAGTVASRCFTESGLKLMKETLTLSTLDVCGSQPSEREHLEHPVLQLQQVGAGMLEFNGQPDFPARRAEDVQQIRQRQQLIGLPAVLERNPGALPRGKIQQPQLLEGPVGHGPGAVRGAVQVRVVQQDNVLVPAEVDVAFHAVGAVGDGLEVGGPGVLREGGAGTAVGVDQRPGGGGLVGSHGDTLADDPATDAGLGWAHAGEH